MRRASRLALLAPLLLGACRTTTRADRRDDPAACPQTYEFGNFGCARVVVDIDGPPTPWPAAFRWDVRVVPARASSGLEPVVGARSGVGPVPLQITLYSPLQPVPVDTLTAWVVARLLDDTGPPAVNVPLPTFAADSVRRVLRFVPVGARALVDTVRLTLRRP